MKQQELQDRFIKFALSVAQVSKTLSKTPENIVYTNQIIRSSASIGANYMEAVCGHTKLDFLHRLNISRKEAKETHYWLALLSAVNQKNQQLLSLSDECEQLIKILTSSVKTTKENLSSKS